MAQPTHHLSTPPRAPHSPSEPHNPDQSVHDFFAPYNRISPPWDAYEVTKTLLLTVFILPFRVLYLLVATAFLLLVASLSMIGVTPSEASHKPLSEDGKPAINFDKDSLFKPLSTWRKLLVSLLFPISRSILFVSFGVYHIHSERKPFPLDTQRNKHPAPTKAYVIVANHLGYIDILVLLCKFRGSFVAKGDLETAPIIGRLARALQCMFVRKGQSLTSQLINRVQATYQCHKDRENCPSCPACMSKLVIFPEGTTTNGTAMVPFRTGVFNAGLPVKPVCIRFPYRHFNLSWETIRFREHMFRTMTQVRNIVHLTELPVYEPSEEEMADARLYASNVQEEIAATLRVPIIPLNRQHKFLYHAYLLGKETSAEEVLRKAEKMSADDEQLVYIMNKEKEDAV